MPPHLGCLAISLHRDLRVHWNPAAIHPLWAQGGSTIDHGVGPEAFYSSAESCAWISRVQFLKRFSHL